MWSYLIAGSAATLLLAGYLIRTNPIIKSLTTSYVNGYGILFNVRVRTLISIIQIPSTRPSFNLVRIERDLDNITIHPLLPFTSKQPIVLKLTFPQPNMVLRYYVNDEPKEWPYEWGTPFVLSEGEGRIVLSQREKKGHRFINRPVAEGKAWPLFPPDNNVQVADEKNREQESCSLKDE